MSFRMIHLAVALALAAGTAPSWAAAGRTSFSAEAAVLNVSIPTVGAQPTFVRAGPVSPLGGAMHENLPALGVPGVAAGDVPHASVIAQNGISQAEASVANLTVVIGGHQVTAGFLLATASAFCDGTSAFVRGEAQVADLRVNGQSVAVLVYPVNFEVPLLNERGVPMGRVIVNEQSVSENGDQAGLSVIALRVEVFGVGQVIIARAQTGIRCAGNAEPGGDFITGGGWITGTPSRAPAHFGFTAGIRSEVVGGQLNYVDRTSGIQLSGTITEYFFDAAGTRRMRGPAVINGVPGFTFEAVAADFGTPGSDDSFQLLISTGYASSGRLGNGGAGGGSIQLHLE